MEFYVRMLLYIGVMSVIVPLILFSSQLVSAPYLTAMRTTNSVYYTTANNVNNTAGNALIFIFPAIVIIAMIIGIVVDIWVATKYPWVVAGVMNIFGVFIMIGIWLVLNNVISNSSILSVFGQPHYPLYQIFASSYLITSMCAAMLISAAFHISGDKRDPRQPR